MGLRVGMDAGEGEGAWAELWLGGRGWGGDGRAGTESAATELTGNPSFPLPTEAAPVARTPSSLVRVHPRPWTKRLAIAERTHGTKRYPDATPPSVASKSRHHHGPAAAARIRSSSTSTLLVLAAKRRAYRSRQTSEAVSAGGTYSAAISMKSPPYCIGYLAGGVGWGVGRVVGCQGGLVV